MSQKENRVRQGIDVEMAIQVFSKYDEDHTDTLSKDQMARVLQDLNHGVAVRTEWLRRCWDCGFDADLAVTGEARGD